MSAKTKEPEYDWKSAYAGLQHSLMEEIDSLKTMVEDVDGCCAARELRRARMSGLEHALAVAKTLENWEW